MKEDLNGLNLEVITPEIEVAHFELKPFMFNMLDTIGQFDGSMTEDARQHLKSFMDICNSFKIQGVHEDVLRLKLFSYSLRDREKTWLNSIPVGSIGSWSELCRDFITRFNPINLYDRIRN